MFACHLRMDCVDRSRPTEGLPGTGRSTPHGPLGWLPTPCHVPTRVQREVGLLVLSLGCGTLRHRGLLTGMDTHSLEHACISARTHTWSAHTYIHKVHTHTHAHVFFSCNVDPFYSIWNTGTTDSWCCYICIYLSLFFFFFLFFF